MSRSAGAALVNYCLPQPGPLSRRLHAMSKYEKQASDAFRPSDTPLSEYEKEQIALHKNMERLRAERLAREKAKRKDAEK
jgi:U3 small nucleolar ribonucleoprotein component